MNIFGTTGPERRAWLDNVLRPVDEAARYYLGPSGHNVLRDVGRALDLSDAADYRDYQDFGGQAVNAFAEGDYWQAAQDAAQAGAAGLAVALPGVAASQLRGGVDAAEEVARLLREGRASDVTDDMLEGLGPNGEARLFDLYESGATGMDLPMDEASRMARARDAGFDVGQRRIRRNDPALEAAYNEADDALAQALRAQRDGQRAALAERGAMDFSSARTAAIEEVKRGEIPIDRVESRTFELAGYGDDFVRPETPDLDALVEAATSSRRAADAARYMETRAGFHGSPDISWLEDAGAGFDAGRTHDLNLAYGQSPAYTTQDPTAASGYTRAGASWGNRGGGGRPGIVPLAVKAENPFNLDAIYSAEEAREILGDSAFSAYLPDDESFSGREIWDALVKDAPSYGDLNIESRLIGGEIDDMLPKTEANRELYEQGFDALSHRDRYNPGGGSAHNVVIPFSAEQLRSRFARFDPRLRHLRNLSAAGAGVAGVNAFATTETGPPAAEY